MLIHKGKNIFCGYFANNYIIYTLIINFSILKRMSVMFNMVHDQLSHRRGQGIYNCDGDADSSTEQA